MDKKEETNPLHGMTLEKILNTLVYNYGWEELGRRINIRCFTYDPSIKSSLAAWAAGGHGGAQSLNYFPQAADGGVPEAFLAAPSLIV